jgi:hypothetical protein
MVRAALLLAALAACASPRLEDTVRFLASDEMRGRGPGTPENRRAAEWILAQFREIGLESSLHEFDFHLFPDRKIRAANVVGLLRGASDEIVVIGAHHDHLGVEEGRIYNGADDNASGVAALLHAARACRRDPPPRTLVFVSFDLEERGMVGSSRFVASNVVDMERVVAMVCLDLVGGTFFKGEERSLFALGSEYSAAISEAVRAESVGGLDVVPVGIFVMEPMGPLFARSDYLAFRRRGIPFVFLSTGTPWYYHTEHDDVERIDFPKLARVSSYVSALTRRIASGPRPEFIADPPATVEDARVMSTRLSRFLADPSLDDRSRRSLEEARAAIDAAIARGAVDGSTRKAMQSAMVTVFQLVGRSRPR